jgi:hypothetical protein
MNQSHICYLCGKQIIGNKSVDHVPPKQFFALEIRKVHKPNLTTLPTHSNCNSSYQKDEEYFVYSLSPLILESYSGSHVYNDMRRRFNEGKNVALVHQMLNEFDANPSGLILPNNKIVKRFDRRRISRVIWKIVRGLYHIENQLILPEETEYRTLLSFPNDKPPEIFFLLAGSDARGKYPAVFDYMYIKNIHDNITWNIWGLLFWDRIITTILFHDVDCRCPACINTSIVHNELS